MTWRSLTAAVLAAYALGLAYCPADEKPAQETNDEATEPSIEYVPLDAPEGMSQAVIVEDAPLVHTRQLLPLDADGNLVGEGSVDKQIEQVLTNLEAVLEDSGSDLDQLVRLHLYALAPPTLVRVRELLSKRLGPAARPAISSVLTPLPRRGALVAVDAVAAGTDSGDGVVLRRCEAVAGDEHDADAAVLPRGGVAYPSGVPEDGGLTESAAIRAMSTLMNLLDHLQLAPEHVVQVKVFPRPVTSAEAVLREVQKFFPDQMTPPVVFVEWLASVPIEIEMVALCDVDRRRATHTVSKYPDAKQYAALSSWSDPGPSATFANAIAGFGVAGVPATVPRRRRRCPRASTGIRGSVRPPSGLTIRVMCHTIGTTGGISGVGGSATWDATTSTFPSGRSSSAPPIRSRPRDPLRIGRALPPGSMYGTGSRGAATCPRFSSLGPTGGKRNPSSPRMTSPTGPGVSSSAATACCWSTTTNIFSGPKRSSKALNLPSEAFRPRSDIIANGWSPASTAGPPPATSTIPAPSPKPCCHRNHAARQHRFSNRRNASVGCRGHAHHQLPRGQRPARPRLSGRLAS